MFQNKVLDQKMELLRALFRNLYLKEKCDYLDNECTMLANNVVSNQVSENEKNEHLEALNKEVKKLKELNDQKLQELLITNEKLETLEKTIEQTTSRTLDSLNENKSMTEELEIKNEMITCLQAELVHVRLQEAEKWALIKELKQIKQELEKDKEVLANSKPETIARLQENLIEAKLLERQHSLQFNMIRQQLEQMKQELASHREKCEGNLMKTGGDVKITKRGALWRSNNKCNKEITEIDDNIKRLEIEKKYLEYKILELQNKVEILSKHLELKHNEKSKLQKILDNKNKDYQSITSLTNERKRQYNYLETTASEKVSAIRISSKEKEENINELSLNFQEISKRRESYTSVIKSKESSTILELESQIANLEVRAAQLKTELAEMYPSNNLEKKFS